MNIDSFNRWFTVIANIGVLAGIVFLAVEVSQNTNMMRSQTRDAVAEKQVDYFFTIGSNLETPSIWGKATSGYFGSETVLSPDERTAFFYLFQGVLRIWENEYYQFQSGLFEEPEFIPRTIAWRRFLDANKGGREVWERVQDAYSPEFVELINGLIE